ncbi:ABC transporter permease [Marinomonas dokdonensis]|uniref:ABC transporter permease n=1 Tax=Marinomonas dokdonensis TaxID=328224 RepID=UPI0040556663
MVNEREIIKFLVFAKLRSQFTRTKLGFSWLFINCFLHIVIIGVVFGYIFSPDNIIGHLKYFSISYTVWYVFSSMVSESCMIWPSNEKYIKNSVVNLYVFLYAHVARFIFILCLNLPFPIVLNYYYGDIAFLNVVYSVLGVILFLFFGFLLSVVLSFLNLKVRDFSRFMPNVLLLTYLSTPILWHVDKLGDNRWVAEYNPIFHVLELIRAPLLDGVVPFDSYIVVASMLIFLSIISYSLYQINKRDIAFYV